MCNMSNTMSQKHSWCPEQMAASHQLSCDWYPLNLIGVHDI